MTSELSWDSDTEGCRLEIMKCKKILYQLFRRPSWRVHQNEQGAPLPSQGEEVFYSLKGPSRYQLFIWITLCHPYGLNTNNFSCFMSFFSFSLWNCEMSTFINWSNLQASFVFLWHNCNFSLIIEKFRDSCTCSRIQSLVLKSTINLNLIFFKTRLGFIRSLLIQKNLVFYCSYSLIVLFLYAFFAPLRAMIQMVIIFCLFDLKVPSGQIKIVWEWYHWIGLESTSTAIGFFIY